MVNLIPVILPDKDFESIFITLDKHLLDGVTKETLHTSLANIKGFAHTRYCIEHDMPTDLAPES